MTSCLLVFVGISGGLNIWLIGNTVRERVVRDELPTAVNGIRADVQRQLAGPITASRSMAINTFLQQWDAAGEPEAGTDTWKQLATNVKAEQKAASVQWVSTTSGNYYTEAGLQRKISDQDQWLKTFLASGKPYEVNMDHEVSLGGYMMFINARVEGANGPTGIAGMALSVDALAKRISGYKIGETGFAYLVHPDGAIMMHPDTALVDGKHFLKDLPGLGGDAMGKLLAGESYAYMIYAAPGGQRYIATSFIPELDAYVVVEVPQAELLGPVESAVRIAALIAAVEAARAGEQGRGFAVVASEVRNLSQRSAQAAKEIKALIEHSTETVDAGSRLVVDAGKVMGDIVAQVEGVSKIMNEITLASVEQSAGIGQIGNAVQQLDQVTQQNAALVEESAAATESLKQQAVELDRLVAVFKIEA